MNYPIYASGAMASTLQLRNSDGNKGWEETIDISPWQNFWVIIYDTDFDMEGNVASNMEIQLISDKFN